MLTDDIPDLEAFDTLAERSAAWASTPEDAPQSPVEPQTDAGTGDTIADAEQAVAEAAASGDVAATEAAVEMLEALLGEEKHQLRADLRLPVSINGTDELVTLSEMQRGYQRTQDYTRKTMELAEQRTRLDAERRQIEAGRRLTEASRTFADTERQRLLEARADPEKLGKYLDHAERLASDPDYKEMWERSERDRLREVEETVYGELTVEEQTERITADIADTAAEFGADPKYAGKVDVRAAIALYQTQLANGTADIKVSDLRKTFDFLLHQRETMVRPELEELQALRTEVARLAAQSAVTTSNDRTRTRVAAAVAAPGRRVPVRTPPVGASTETASATRAAPVRETLQDRSRAWAAS